MKPAAHAERIRRVATTRMPTQWGTFQAIGFEREISNGSRRIETALALVLGDVRSGAPLARIHSQCFTGEMIGSLRCDCAQQLEMAMGAIAEERRGLLIYEYQEGRGIGLMAKLQAYELQDNGLDTVEANHKLGFEADHRDFSLPVAILHELGVRRVRLLSNNPKKTRALLIGGIEVVEQVSCEVEPTEHSLEYLQTKKMKMGHLLTKTPLPRLQIPIHWQSPDCASCESGQLGLHRETIFEPPIVDRNRSSERGPEEHFESASIEAAISELRAGRMVVVVDDEDRENEGDLTMAAEMITPEAINFMATHGRGLICLAMTGERLDELEIPQMAPENTALGGTAFTVSIDVKGPNITTGISAQDRAQTIWAVTNASSRPEDFARPGHVFPLQARPGGVLERRGQTEAAVDLANLAGLYPAGVICEIVNDDGTMARVPDLIRFCRKHDLVMITVSELARYRMDQEDDGVLEALEGFLPAFPRFPLHGVQPLEPSNLFPAFKN